MLKKWFLYFILFILIISIVSAVPGTWYGYVTINGLDAPKSTPVYIFVNNIYIKTVFTGSVSTAPENYYIVAVEGVQGDTVTFQVNGINASQKKEWGPGYKGHMTNVSLSLASNGSSCSLIPETCDGEDNNCDGIVDNREPPCNCVDDETRQCGITNVGVCQYGTQTCLNGDWQSCEENIDPAEEILDGLDNDCDGTIDGGFPFDLSNYPEPFVINEINSILVVGDNAPAEETAIATDIAISLQYSASAKTIDTTIVEGDAYLIEASNNKLNFRENLREIVESLTHGDLASLKSGRVSNEKGTFTYYQLISLGNATIQFNVDSDHDNDDPAIYLKFSEDTNTDVIDDGGQEAYVYKLIFPTALKSDIDSNGDWDDIDNKDFLLLGKTMTVVNTNNSSGQIDFMGGVFTDTLEEGASKTYILDGKDYVVTATIICDTCNPHTVKMTVNGETTNELQQTETYKLADGTEIGIKAIIPNEAGDVTQDIVEFYLGTSKVTMKLGSFGSKGSLEVGGEEITDVILNSSGIYTSGDVHIGKIQVAWEPSEDYYIAIGEKLSDRLSGDGKERLFLQNLDFVFADMVFDNVEEIEFYPSGTDKYKAKVTNKDGNETSLPLFYYNSSTTSIHCGKDTDHRLFASGGSVNVPKYHYFVVGDISQGKYSHLLKFSGLDTTNHRITLTDQGSGIDLVADYIADGGTATWYLNGYSYTATVSEINKRITTTTSRYFWTQQGGKLDLNCPDSVVARNKTTFYENYKGHENLPSIINQIHVNLTYANEQLGDSISIDSDDRTEFDAAKAGMQDFYSKDNYSEAYTKWGTRIIRNSYDEDTVWLKHPGTEAYGKVYVTSGVTTIIAPTTPIGTINVSRIKSASEVPDIKSINAILIGDSCSNKAIAKLINNREDDCLNRSIRGYGELNLIYNEPYYQLIVTGYTINETRIASMVLTNYDKFNMTGKHLYVYQVNDKIMILKNTPECTVGQIKHCGTTEIGACQYGIQTCVSGEWDNCTGNIEPANETCDGIDQDCDNRTDEDYDKDFDNYTTCGTLTINGSSVLIDCNDNNASISPAAIESCNGIDDNCNNITDETHDDSDKDKIADCVDSDDDNDGVDDSSDLLIGNASSINSNTITSFLEIDGSTDLGQAFSGVKYVVIKDNNISIVELRWNFSRDRLNLYNITIDKQENNATGTVLIRGISLPQGETKTVYLDDLSTTDTLCIKDQEITSISEISYNCNAEGEVSITCNGTARNYNCTDLGNRYKLTGLQHSGITEYTYLAPSPSTGGGGGGSAISSPPIVAGACIPNWDCTAWKDCTPAGTRKRSCLDINFCYTTEGKPSELEPCKYEEELKEVEGDEINLSNLEIKKEQIEEPNLTNETGGLKSITGFAIFQGGKMSIGNSIIAIIIVGSAIFGFYLGIYKRR